MEAVVACICLLCLCAGFFAGIVMYAVLDTYLDVNLAGTDEKENKVKAQ